MDASAALAKAMTLHARLVQRRPDIEKTESYFDGNQPLTFASPEWAKVHQSRYRGFADNWCGVVGAAPAERTVVDGFRLGLDTDAISADEQLLWRDWEINDGPAQSSQGFQTGIVSRRSFALVWGDDNDEPTLSWEHPSQAYVEYAAENPRQRIAGIKSWADDGVEFLTLYTETEVFKWERKAAPATATNSGIILPAMMSGDGTWTPRQGESDDTWPIANPMGLVPMVEYANRPRLGHGPQSDIQGTMAMQDAVNLLWAYLFVAADHASMPARVVTGAERPNVPILDDNGNVIGKKPVTLEALSQGRLLFLEGAANTSQWDAAKLDVFTDTINVAIRHIAAQTRTPIYLIHGELGNVNGETLIGLDAPLVSKVNDAETAHTASVRETFRLFAAVRNNTKVAEAARVGGVQWRNPALISDALIADAAIKAKSAGMPFQAVLETVYGKSPSEVARIMDMARNEASDPTFERVARDLGGQ